MRSSCGSDFFRRPEQRIHPLRIYRQREIPDMLYAHPAEFQIIRLIKRKNVIAVVKHRFMVHTDQRIVARPGNIFHACALTDIRYQRKIVHRKDHIIMRTTDLLLDHPLKFRTYVITSEFLLDIIHRIPKQKKGLLDVSVIICFPSVHQYVHRSAHPFAFFARSVRHGRKHSAR